jgi:DNA-binding response OmpR family regulator
MKILLVEDNRPLSEMLSVALERQHFVVDTAYDGEEAFEKIRKDKYEMVVLDLMLPHKSGFEVIKNVRALKITTPILVISAISEVKDRITALNLGADDYLVKNFAIPELIARMKSLIRRNNNQQNNILRCGDLIVNLTTNTAYQKQLPIRLTRTEFRLLLNLMMHKNSFITTKELCRAVWGDTEIMSNKLSVHMRSLRGKIEGADEANKDLIKNRRDYGYMITDQ